MLMRHHYQEAAYRCTKTPFFIKTVTRIIWRSYQWEQDSQPGRNWRKNVLDNFIKRVDFKYSLIYGTYLWTPGLLYKIRVLSQNALQNNNNSKCTTMTWNQARIPSFALHSNRHTRKNKKKTKEKPFRSCVASVYKSVSLYHYLFIKMKIFQLQSDIFLIKNNYLSIYIFSGWYF